MGIVALRSGESELATVVRAPTECVGLQSTLGDFSLRGHVGDQVGCNSCGWGGPSTRSRKRPWRHFESPKCQGWKTERCTNNVPWAESLLRHTKARNLPVGGVASNSGNLGLEGFYVKILPGALDRSVSVFWSGLSFEKWKNEFENEKEIVVEITSEIGTDELVSKTVMDGGGAQSRRRFQRSFVQRVEMGARMCLRGL